jgi:hypothetical protein
MESLHQPPGLRSVGQYVVKLERLVRGGGMLPPVQAVCEAAAGSVNVATASAAIHDEFQAAARTAL